MRKNVILIIACFITLVICVIGIITVFKEDTEIQTDKINIIVTLFPEYDFVKKIGGDKVNAKLLLNSGVDSHTYEPSVKDMKRMADSDIFIYTGDSQEPWAKNIIESMDSDCKVIDCSQNIEMIELEEFEHEYSAIESSEEHVHNHGDLEDYEYDGHIWLSPKNAIIMIDTICDSLCEFDYKNKDFYMSNASNYKNEILKLDSQIEEKLKSQDVLVFGGEFAYSYFIKRYDLNYVSVYSSCGEGADPSVSEVRQVIDYINENNIKKVFYEELSEGTVAKMISEETNAKPVIFYTLHNVSQEQIDNGENYITIMRKNLDNILN